MYTVFIYCLLSILVSFKTSMASTPDDFWQEYQTVKKSGLVQNAVSHVKRLSIRLETDTPERLESKKSAILWFMATGGKNGFRKTVATPEEKLILENALIFATILHRLHHPKKFLQIVVVRRDADISDEDQRIQTHLVAAQRVMTATRIMMGQRYGRIINMSSVSGLIGNAGQTNYSATKAGMIGFTRSLSKEMAKRKITVNAVAPGFIESEMTKALGDSIIDEVKKRVPANRLGTGDDVAACVLFLASRAASYVTGQVITVDGGMTG